MAFGDTIRKFWQARRDGAIALADKAVGVSPRIYNPPGYPETGAPALGGIPAIEESGNWRPLAPAAPIPEAPVGPDGARPGKNGDGAAAVIETRDASGFTSIYGVSATIIAGGFLYDVGEYNGALKGRNAVKIYEQMRRGDGQVDATLEACIQPILSAQWDVVTQEDGGRASGAGGRVPTTNNRQPKTSASLAKQIADAAKENLFGGLESRTSFGGLVTQSWAEVLRNTLLMLAFGCSAYEEVWTVDGDQVRLRMLADLPPVTFYQWDVEPDGRTLRGLVQYGWRRDRFERCEVPGDKLTLFTYRQEGANFWGRSLLRAAYPHWYVKNALYRIDAIAAERNGMGIPCITLPPDCSAEDRQAAITFVTQLAAHERTGITLPAGATFKLHGVEGIVRDIMPTISHHNEQITLVALAALLNLGRTQTGSRAVGQTQNKFFLLAIQNIADYVAWRITTNTLRRWTYYNYGPDAPVPRLKVANVQARSFEEMVDALLKLSQAGAFVSDLPVRQVVRGEIGLPAETSEGLVSVKGETVTVGKDTGDIAGKSSGDVGGGKGGAAPPAEASDVGGACPPQAK